MSRAFVKESDGDDGASDALPPESPHPILLTPQGARRMTEAFGRLTVEYLALDPEDSDPAIQHRRRRLRRDARILERKLARAEIIDPAHLPTDRVGFGLRVTVAEDGGGPPRIYQITGEDEADPALGRVSWLSPLAKVLMEAELGERVEWHRPAGLTGLTILAIAAPEIDEI